mgnify:CR=1 FL=1
MKKFDFSKEFGNIDPKYIEEAEREWSEKKENRRPKGWMVTEKFNFFQLRTKLQFWFSVD